MANAYKVVGQDNPGAALTTLYTVPSATSFVGQLLIANRATATKTFRVAIRPAGASIANKHYIAYDTALPANDTITITGISLATTDKLDVYSSDGNVSFTLTGVEIT